MTAAESIRELTLPVVLISANGLICLALYNRLAAVTSRLRAFCREQFEMNLHLAKLEEEPRPSKVLTTHLQNRIAVLEKQRNSILSRAIQLRNALIMLLSAIIGMLTSSLLLGIAQEFSLHPGIPLTAFVIGTLAMIAGIVLAIGELTMTLEPVQAETSFFADDGERLNSPRTSQQIPERIRAPNFLQNPVYEELSTLETES